MKNVTITLDEKTAAWARNHAWQDVAALFAWQLQEIDRHAAPRRSFRGNIE